MALRAAPVAGPGAAQARADVGGVAEAGGQGARLARLQLDLDRDDPLHRTFRRGVHPHIAEVVGGHQRPVELAETVGVVALAGLERHQALQHAVVERRVAAEHYGAEAIARAAAVDQADIREPGLGVDRQALLDEGAIEEAVAQRLVTDQLLGVLVGAVVEHRAGAQQRAGGLAEVFHLRRLALHADLHAAQTDRLALLDMQAQYGLVPLLDHLAADAPVVVAQGLQCLGRRQLGRGREAAQGGGIPAVERADVSLDIFAQGFLLGVEQHFQLCIGRRGGADEQSQQQKRGGNENPLHAPDPSMPAAAFRRPRKAAGLRQIARAGRRISADIL